MLAYAVNHYAVYLLVLLRVVAFIGTSPILSVRGWPIWAKLGLAAFVAMYAAPVVGAAVPDPFTDPANYIITALQETVIGMLLGFLATLVFSATSIAGQLFDIQIGFSSATLFDPQAGQATGLTGQFLSLLFTLYFLGLNGLDGLMLGILHSYQYVPLGHFTVWTSMWQVLTHLLSTVMILGIQVGAPLMVALLLTDVTFAFLSRAVPQMNVFVVGQPAKLFVGLTVFAAVMPGVVYLFGSVFRLVFAEMDTVLKWLGG